MKHVLTLTNDALVVARCDGARVLERLEYVLTVAGTQAFEDWLKGHAEVPTLLLLDLAELDFRLDTVAHLSGRDRDAVLARRLAQTFRATPYRHARVEGREATGRRDDRVLFSAVSNADVLRPWFDLLRQYEVPLASATAAPLVGGGVLAALRPTASHAMLVTVPTGGGLRQSYFRDGELKFSRLTRLAANETTSLSALVEGEVARTWQYLEGQRAFGLDDRLDVVVLTSNADAEALSPALRPTEQITYAAVGVGAAAALLGVRLPPGCEAADALLAAQAARRPPANQFATAADLQSHVVRQAKRSILAVAAGVLALGVGWAGYTALKAQDAEDRALWQAVQTRSLQERTQALQSARGSAGVASATMRDTVIFYQRYLARPALISEFLQPVSEVLAANPNIQLVRVVWQPADGDRLAAPQDQRLPPVNNPTQTAREAAPLAAATTGEPTRYGPRATHMALIEAEVRLGSLDTRGARSVADALAASISRQPGYSATVDRYALDTEPARRIEGKLGSEPLYFLHNFVLAVGYEPSKAAATPPATATPPAITAASAQAASRGGAP